MRTVAALLLVLGAGLPGCRPGEPGARRGETGGPRGERVLYLVPRREGAGVPDGSRADVVARVEVAADFATRQRGLMHRDGLDPDCGMLFVYSYAHRLDFWMKNTRIPLSIAFADGSGRIVGILDMEPGVGIPEADLPRYESPAPAIYALEMEKGWFAAKDLVTGDRVALHPEIRAIRAE